MHSSPGAAAAQDDVRWFMENACGFWRARWGAVPQPWHWAIVSNISLVPEQLTEATRSFLLVQACYQLFFRVLLAAQDHGHLFGMGNCAPPENLSILSKKVYYRTLTL